MSKTQEVIDYLKKHPSFFEDHEELLVELTLGPDENVTPFYARQLKVLKERESQQQTKIDIIVDGAKNNQRLEADLLEMSIRLLSEGRNELDPCAMVIALVKRQFNVNNVLILLNNQDSDIRHPKYDEVRQRIDHKSSVCDDRVSSTLLESLYGSEYIAIKSCAFVPVIYSEMTFGVMVLGSDAEDRFQPGIGVMYLDRLGLLVGGYLEGVK